MSGFTEKAVAFATAMVADVTPERCFVELRGEQAEWTEFRSLHSCHFTVWTWATEVSIALSRAGLVIGWAVDKRRRKGSAPLLTDDELERRARTLVRHVREDTLVSIERVPVEGSGSYAVLRFTWGWVAIDHGDGTLLGYMPSFADAGQKLAAGDRRVNDAREAVWEQLDRDFFGRIEASALEEMRSSLQLTVDDAELHEHGVVVCSLGLWSYYSTFDVSIDTASDAIVRWRFDALSEVSGPHTADLDPAVAVAAAQAHVPSSIGVQGPTITKRGSERETPHTRVYWWHAEGGVNVEGDYATAMVNPDTGKVFAVAHKWRHVDLPAMRARSRVSADQAQEIADTQMGEAASRFRAGSLVGLNVIELEAEAGGTRRVVDRLVWRIRYKSIDGMSLVEISVDCETGRVVRTTGW